MGPPSAGPRSRLRWLLASLVLLTLTGCFDVLQEIWLLPDGSARALFDVSLPESFLNLARARGVDPLEELRATARATEEELKKDPDVTKFEFREYTQDGQQHVVYDLTVRDATRLGELQKRAMERNSSTKPGKAELTFNIERRGAFGEYVFVQRFGQPRDVSDSPTGTKNPSKQVAQDFGMQMARALLGQHHYTVRVHGHSILEANGTLNEKKNTVEWKYNLADLATEAEQGTELRAVVQAGPTLWLWAVMLGVPVLVLLLAVMAARRQRARRAV